MTIDTVIFDLDLTLVDTLIAEKLRKDRNWPAVYKLIPDMKPYVGVDDLIAQTLKLGCKVSIVTSSPSSYCKKIISQWKWPIETTVCYHDTVKKKPHPEPILAALEKLGSVPETSIAVGDTVGDIQCAQNAGVRAIAALWGSQDIQSVLREKPTASFQTATELMDFITKNASA